MDIHTILSYTSAVIAAVVYLPLTYKVWTGRLTQNFATYFLWGLLDAIAGASIWLKGGNFLLPALYALLSFGVIAAIIRAGLKATAHQKLPHGLLHPAQLAQFVRRVAPGIKWSWRESVTSTFVVGSIIVWCFLSNEAATVASTAGVIAAGLPQLYDVWKRPRRAPVLEYIGFTAANALSTMAGHDWSIQERLYGGSCTILTIIFVAIAWSGLRARHERLITLRLARSFRTRFVLQPT